jgi:NADPH:quinone reductase-like Zn-dependent oxidoreductase
MKAIVHRRYGPPDVLRLEEIDKPTAADGEVLVKVHAASVNAGDWRVIRGEPLALRLASGLLRPRHRVPGADVAGRVEAVGRHVTRFQCGDDVFGDISRSGFGAFAEYVSVPEAALVSKPTNLSFEEAAAVPAAGVTALQALRDTARMQRGQKVLINGASGGVGTFAVQIAKALGAVVTGVCSTRNVNLVRSLGADHVIDYTREDFTRNGERYDVIVAVNGYHSIWDYKRALSPAGVYATSGGSGAQMAEAMFLGPCLSLIGSKTMGNMLMKPRQADLVALKDLVEAGKIAPVVERRYALREVPDAIRYVEEGHARGKVVITVSAADHAAKS